MILINTGNGKGKTTSAIGTAIRSAGWNRKTAIIFFDKGGDHYGEQKSFDSLDSLESYRFGKQRFDEASKTFRFENTADDKAEVQKGIDKLLTLYKEGYFLIVADELINCLNLGLITEMTVRELIDTCPPDTHLLLTGRNVPEWLAEKADLVSEIKEVKHYFKKGQQAIKGLDY
ncbi:cob(I)yrinic acid a,c-diamide adenosyltransferase [Candidatus Pacearchaeota archaeon]|nr:cob(I)yrinic acid a,c-diamide adenosyltransferase [Candidatus Pacearchaeota archaeon]